MTEQWLYPVERMKWSLLAVRVARWAAIASLIIAILDVEILVAFSWEGRGEWAWVAVGGFYLSVGLASAAIICRRWSPDSR